MVDVIPIIAIPAVILAHWRRVFTRYRDTGMVPRYGSADWARMTDFERIVTFLGTLALFVYLTLVVSDGDTPNGLAAGGAIVFAAYLALDFYVGVRYPERRRK